MKGRVCLVTGATNGIGKAVATEFAARGATLLIHGRDPGKTERTRRELAEQSGNDDIQCVLADFASLAQVRALVDQVRERTDRLHVLANNAGVLTDHRQVSADGFELTFAVNHLAPFLLTQLLLPMLERSAPSSISFNSSSAMGSASIRFDDLQMERGFHGWTAYANTKLANFWVSNLLAERLDGTGVVCNSYCPGLIDTDLLTGNREFGEDYVARLRAQMRTADEGAITPVYLTTAPEADGVTGAFFLKSHGFGRLPLHPTWDRDSAVRLWKTSEACVSGSMR